MRTILKASQGAALTELFSIRPLPGAGAEVLGLDLCSDPRGELIETLRQAFASHHLLLFRAQHLSPERQIEVVSWFGPVLDNNGTRYGYVSNVRPDGLVPEGPLLFHSDMAFCPDPYLGIALHALDVPDDVADTLFAGAAAAVEKLPSQLRCRLGGLQVRNAAGFRVNFAARQREEDVDEREPRHDHPVLGFHPVTRTPVVMANECHSVRLVGVDEEESSELLDQLFGVLYAEDNVYSHHWASGDLVVFDNIAIQHGRREVDPLKPRTLQRVVMAHGSTFVMTPPLRELYARSTARGRGETTGYVA